MDSVDTIEKTRVFKGEGLRATCFFPRRKNLLVCFDHRRDNRNGFPNIVGGALDLKRFGTAILNIHTSANDWFLNADLPLLRRAARRFTRGFDTVTAHGFSMGGYAALLLAPDLRLTYATIISPQYSIQPSRVPFEKRYLEDATQIDPQFDQFDLEYAKTLKGALLYDPLWIKDRMHKKLICNDFPRLTPIPFWTGGHPAIKVINANDKWPSLMREVAKPRPQASEMMRLHKSLRAGFAHYKNSMNNHLSMRKHSKLRIL